MPDAKPDLLHHKYYDEPSVFEPENLLREARRQKQLKACPVPEICLLDPDGDLVSYLRENGRAERSECWACYHSELYTSTVGDISIGIIPCAVGASYAVLVAEQLFVSGCKLLLSITSAGIVNEEAVSAPFALITKAVRDEGTSYHYLPAEKPAALSMALRERLQPAHDHDAALFFEAGSWTTDAPYRETPSALEAMARKGVVCVEMEAAALYAFAEARGNPVLCFAHLTNTMARNEGDFEKGEAFGSLKMMELMARVLPLLRR